jgi:MFS family permease
VADGQVAGLRGAPRRVLNLPLWKPLAIRDFRLVWIGESISVLGDQFYAVALPWLVLQMSNSALTLSTVLMVGIIPRTILILLGGAIVDRTSPRLLMLGSNAVRCVVVGALAVLVLTGHAQLWYLYVVSFVAGVVAAVFYPAFDSINPSLLPEESLGAGNAVLQGSAQLAGLIGPVLAGAIIAAMASARGNGTALTVDAVSFGVATVALTFMRGGGRRRAHQEYGTADIADGEAAGLLADIREGVAYVWHEPILRSMVMVTLAANFAVAGPVEIGLATLAHNRYHSAAAFGLMLTAFGVGALIGTVTVGARGTLRRRGPITIALCASFSVGLVLIGLSPNPAPTAVILALLGVGNGVLGVGVITWLQAGAAPHMLGRVMSVFAFSSFGLTPLSFLLSGIIAQINVTLLFSLGAAVMALVTVGVTFNRPLRTFD